MLVAGSVCVVAAALGACTSEPTTTPGPMPLSPAPTWQRATLPEGLTPVTVTTDGDTLLVGAFATERPHARLLALSASGIRDVPLTPRSPYAFEAHWFEITARDGTVDAIAGARGGAHGNYRWSTWSGTPASVEEQEQPFGVFGSYGAGDLAGIAYAGRSPVILGAWQSEATGLDIATWTRTGNRWSRQPSTGTPLASTAEELVDARAITSLGDGLLLSGSVTQLRSGEVKVVPAVWTSPGATGPWTRRDLSRAGTKGTSVAQSATCTGDHCALAGVTDGHLDLWEVTPDSASQPPGIPKISVPDNALVPAPMGPPGHELVVAPTSDGSTVVRRDGDDWAVGDGPAGPPVAAAEHDGEVWVVTTAADGSGTLWHARVA